MKFTTFFLLPFLLVIISTTGFSQQPKWVEMMNDPAVNFYLVQEEFNNYFEEHENGKGSGWKQFKRWEYMMEQRLYPHGERTRISAGHAWEETEEFRRKMPKTHSENRSTWTELGPRTSATITGHYSPGIGRIDAIAIHPTNDSIIYCGSPTGGLWKTTDEGNSWTPLTDYLPVIGISSIAINPQTPDVVYIATGDKDYSSVYSTGVLRSLDGGNTWQQMGLDWNATQFRTIRKLLINPDSTNILYAAANNGLYKSVDAGISWTNIYPIEFEDIELRPGNPNVIYGVSSDHRFYRSTDGGLSFNMNSSHFLDRCQIAVTEANPTFVYVLSSAKGLHKSTDSGLSFTDMGIYPDKGSIAWYALALAVSHTSPNLVHFGEFDTWVSNNAGNSFIRTSEWLLNNSTGYVHCDIHEMVCKGNDIYVGSDGLISKSTDNGATWINLTEGMGIKQFYRMGCSATHPDKIVGGSQDNGTSVMTNGDWHEWIGGDGMECIVDYTNKDIVYGTQQYGNFNKSTTGALQGNTPIAQPGQGAWVTPFVIDPVDPQILYAGTSQLMKTTNGMASWSNIGSFGSGNITALAIAPSNPNYIYAAKGPALWMTNDGGTSWNIISSNLPNLIYTYISVSYSDPEKVAISFSGYNQNDKIYISDDAGSTWANISGNLPNLPANCIIFQNDSLNSLYVGMDAGVFYRNSTLGNWLNFSDDLPNVIVNELEIQYGSGKLRAATYGRGIWEADLVSPPNITAFELNFDSLANDNNNNGVADPGESLNLYVSANNYGNINSAIATVTLNANGQGSQYVSINTTQNSIGQVAPGFAYPSIHSIEIDGLTPAETTIELTFSITDGTNSAELLVPLIISNPPSYFISDSVVNSCSGYFFDTGGEFNHYNDNENYELVLYPSDPSRKVVVDFIDFNIDFYPNCELDFLKIFDGTNTNSTLLGKYCGTNTPGIVQATNNEGALCFHFYSDIFVSKPGWKAKILCNPSLDNPSPEKINRLLIKQNPSAGIFNIQIIEEGIGDVEIRVVNTNGQLIYQQKRRLSDSDDIQVDLNDQPSGIYHLSIATPNKEFKRKLVITK